MNIAELYKIYLKHPTVFTDTRLVKQDGIFFALKGGNFDGNLFAAAALQQGAAYAVVDDPNVVASANYILVDDVLTALQQLAAYHRSQFSIPFIAITGSNGKTTTKELLTVVLASKYKTVATIGNLNNHIGIPLTILSVPFNTEMAIIEMGANHQREIAGYCTYAQPTHGIITNCGKAHIEGFGGEEGVRKGKGELYDFLRNNNGIVFRNTDLDYLGNMSIGVTNQVLYGSSIGQYTGQLLMDGVFLSVDFTSNGKTYRVNTKLVGSYNYANVMTAIAVGLYFGVEPLAIVVAIESYNPDNSRSQWVKKGSNSIILDAYNANPSSMKAAITNFATTTLPNKILWLGAMKEMGPAEQAEHTELVKLIANYTWADVILVGKEFLGLQGSYKWFADSAAAAAYIQHNTPVNSTILIKGSRGSKMEVMASVL